MIKILTLSTLILVLTSCQNPQSTFDQIILDSGFLPFRNPMSDANVGTIIKGIPSSLFLVAPARVVFHQWLEITQQSLYLRTRQTYPSAIKNS